MRHPVVTAGGEKCKVRAEGASAFRRAGPTSPRNRVRALDALQCRRGLNGKIAGSEQSERARQDRRAAADRAGHRQASLAAGVVDPLRAGAQFPGEPLIERGHLVQRERVDEVEPLEVDHAAVGVDARVGGKEFDLRQIGIAARRIVERVQGHPIAERDR